MIGSSIGSVMTRNLVRGVGRMAGWAARTGYELSRYLPGVDDGAPAGDPATSRRELQATGPRPEPSADGDPLRVRAAALLAESAELGRDDARQRLYEQVLSDLVPDEVRILATLADGAPHPAVDVAERTALGGVGRTVLRNASTVGATAGVVLTEGVPVYVTRLVGAGLADLTKADSALDTQYEVLVADDAVVEAARLARRPTYVRRTLRISQFGANFWQAVAP